MGHQDSPARAASQSLLGRVWRKVHRNADDAVDLTADLIEPGSSPFAPFPFVQALEQLSGLCGKPAARAHLVAGLPAQDGDLDHRFASFALARVGLDARWETVSFDAIRGQDLPALVPLNQGGAILLQSIAAAKDMATIVDTRGERSVTLEVLATAAEGKLLVCGHLDPENGIDDEAERSLVQRNPKLWLLGTFLSERRRLGEMLIGALFLNLCALAIPLYMRAIYDRVVPNLAIESLWALSVGMVVVLTFELLFRHLRGTLVDSLAVRLGQAVQHKAMHSVLQAQRSGSTKSVGAFLVGLRDVEQLSVLAPQAMVTFLVDVPWFFAYLLLIYLIGGAVVMGPLVAALGMVVVGLIANYALKLASGRTSKLMQARNNLIVEVTEGLPSIKANQAEGLFLRQWDIVADHIGVGTKNVRHWNELPGAASSFLVQLATVLVVIIGVFQIKDGIMTTGALVAVTMLTGRAMVPVSTAISLIGKLYQSLTQFQGLAQILAMEPERSRSDPSIKAQSLRGEIRISNLTHKFEGTSEHSLNGVSLNIEPGEKIAVIGRSGSGKSTLLQIMGGLLQKEGGSFTVDGHAVDQYAGTHLRRSIIYSSQDAALFDRSIWENILLGMPEPDEKIVQKAIKASGLDSFVSRSVDGYGRRVGPHGSRLSGGQRQCLLLARALVRDPSVLLLDEPTAAMDINSEAMVINGLREAAEGKTLIVATHRLALLDLVDRVIWLEDGRIVADKPRAEILAMLRNANAARAGGTAA